MKLWLSDLVEGLSQAAGLLGLFWLMLTLVYDFQASLNGEKVRRTEAANLVTSFCDFMVAGTTSQEFADCNKARELLSTTTLYTDAASGCLARLAARVLAPGLFPTYMSIALAAYCGAAVVRLVTFVAPMRYLGFDDEESALLDIQKKIM